VRLALAALLALAGLAARAWPGDPLALDEFDPLAQAALPFALLSGWPRGAPGARAPGQRTPGQRTPGARSTVDRTTVERTTVERTNTAAAGFSRAAADSLATAGAWSVVALCVLAVGARLHQVSGRPLAEWGTWYIALALAPALAEAAAARAAHSVVGARVHAWLWCIALAGPLLVVHGLAFASARDAAAASVSVSASAGWIEWLARCSPLEFALTALVERTRGAAFAAAALPVLCGSLVFAAVALASGSTARPAGPAERSAA
jgi:hypothetical protein